MEKRQFGGFPGQMMGGFPQMGGSPQMGGFPQMGGSQQMGGFPQMMGGQQHMGFPQGMGGMSGSMQGQQPTSFGQRKKDK